MLVAKRTTATKDQGVGTGGGLLRKGTSPNIYKLHSTEGRVLTITLLQLEMYERARNTMKKKKAKTRTVGTVLKSNIKKKEK